MDTSLIPILIETRTPTGLTFNQWGVAQRGFEYTFRFQLLIVTFHACAINGVWAGSFDLQSNTFGCCSPIMRRGFTWTSFEECVDNLWRDVFGRLQNSEDANKPSFLHFKVAFKKWFTLSSEEKFNLFEEVNFYGK